MVTGIDDAEDNMKDRIAQRLLAAASTFQTEHRRRLMVSNPPASKPGEYPHGRSWQGMGNSALYEPTDLETVKHEQKIRIGQSANTWYMLYLEEKLGRLGYKDTMRDMREKIRQIVVEGKQ